MFIRRRNAGRSLLVYRALHSISDAADLVRLSITRYPVDSFPIFDPAPIRFVMGHVEHKRAIGLVLPCPMAMRLGGILCNGKDEVDESLIRVQDQLAVYLRNVSVFSY